jgi:hypothetical protein
MMTKILLVAEEIVRGEVVDLTEAIGAVTVRAVRRATPLDPDCVFKGGC